MLVGQVGQEVTALSTHGCTATKHLLLVRQIINTARTRTCFIDDNEPRCRSTKKCGSSGL